MFGEGPCVKNGLRKECEGGLGPRMAGAEGTALTKLWTEAAAGDSLAAN